MGRLCTVLFWLSVVSACGATPPAPRSVEIVSATDRHAMEFLDTKILEELRNPLFGGLAVKGTAEWQKAAAGYASSLRLAAYAIDAKGFTFNVTVTVDGGVSDRAVAQSMLATDAAKQFVDQLAARMRANARQFAGTTEK